MLSGASSSSGFQRGGTVLTVLIVVAVLYFGRVVLVPLALAVLLAFMLTPLVNLVRRGGLGRTPASLVVVFLAVVVLGSIGAVMVSQLADLGRQLPGYEQNVHRKLESLRASGNGIITRACHVVRNLTEELNLSGETSNRSAPGEEKPVPVEIRRSPFSPMEMIQSVLSSLVNVALTAGIVVVFVVFLLIQQEDLRDRVLRLAGAGRMSLTTRVLDDAGRRVSRYLLAQVVVNVTYGAVVGTGLDLLGVPNPLLWGMLATLLRYVPYLGIWIAVTMPLAVVFAVEPGWIKLLGILGLYVGTDLLMYNLVEPLLYGSSTGVSPLAILLAAVFWAWLWGPVGLLLATPLTVCVVVMGRHVPSLSFLGILFGDEPVLGPEARFYQRLLAMDLDEAVEIANRFLQAHSLGALYDQVLIPALSMAEEDRHRERLDSERQRFVLRNTRRVLEQAAARGHSGLINGHAVQPLSGAPPGRVFCVPARDDADALAGHMLKELLLVQGWSVSALEADELALESVLQRIHQEQPQMVCVLAIPPFGYMHARYWCRRIQEEFGQLKIVAAILTERGVEETLQRQPPVPAQRVACSLQQTVEELRALGRHPEAAPPEGQLGRAA